MVGARAAARPGRPRPRAAAQTLRTRAAAGDAAHRRGGRRARPRRSSSTPPTSEAARGHRRHARARTPTRPTTDAARRTARSNCAERADDARRAGRRTASSTALITQRQGAARRRLQPDRLLPLHRHRRLRRRAPRRQQAGHRRPCVAASPASSPRSSACSASRSWPPRPARTPAARRVLVATDCLSEGVNLQEDFDAVVHYDLAWNPTRHEQREGRVDRFGQRATSSAPSPSTARTTASTASSSTSSSGSTAQIRKDLGISVPVPRRAATGVIDAVVEGLLLRGGRPSQEALFDARRRQVGTRRPAGARLEVGGRTEKASRSRFAQHAIKPEEVAREVAEVRAALGSARARSASSSGRPGRAATRVLRAGRRRRLHRRRSAAPRPACGTRSPPALGADAVETDRASRSATTPAVARGEAALVRTDPVVGALARYVLDAALDAEARRPAPGPPLRRDPHERGAPPAPRCSWSATASTSPCRPATASGSRSPRTRGCSPSQGAPTNAELAAARSEAAGPAGRDGRRRTPTGTSAERTMTRVLDRPARPDRPPGRRTATSWPPSCAPRTAGSAPPSGEIVRGLTVAAAAARRRPRRLRLPARRCEVTAGSRLMSPPPATRSSPPSTRSAGCSRPTCCVRIAEGKDAAGHQARRLPPARRRALGPRRGRARLGLPQAAVARAAQARCPATRRPGARRRPDRPGHHATGCSRSSRELGFGALTALGAGGHRRRLTATRSSRSATAGATCPSTCSAGTPTLGQAARRPAQVPPQSMVQECLNRTDDHLWGVLTNGRQLRLLRDSSALATAVLRRVRPRGDLRRRAVQRVRAAVPRCCTHPASRWRRARRRRGAGWRSGAPRPSTPAPAPWTSSATGVQQAIDALGTGFLAPPGQRASCARTSTPTAPPRPALLRLVYRLLSSSSPRTGTCCSTRRADAGRAERVRHVLLHGPAARATPGAAGGTATTTCRGAARSSSTRLGDEDGRPELGLPGLGGLFDAHRRRRAAATA